MKTVTIYRTDTGRVTNITEVDDGWPTGAPDEWGPPTGHAVLDDGGGPIGHIWNGSSYVPPTPPTEQERFDRAFLKSDFSDVIVAGFHEHENRIRALEGQPSVTLAQVRNWLRDKLT